MAIQDVWFSNLKTLIQNEGGGRRGIRAVADASGLSEEYVYQLAEKKLNSKGLPREIGKDAANKIAIAFANGRNIDWFDESTQSGVISPYNKTNKPPAGVSIAQYAINLVNNPEYPAIRRVSLKAQAGVSGYAVEYLNDDGPPIVFRADWYKSKGYRPDRMLALRVFGESMIPSLYEDDLIVVNTEQTTPKQGVPFLVSYEGEVVVKRLVRDDGVWWLVSDNPDQRRYPRVKCNGGTQIVGEVVYRQTERV